MKKLLFIAFLIAFLPVFFAGCYGGSSAGNTSGKTFAEQYAELEKQPVQPTAAPGAVSAFQTADDRKAAVAIAAQRERRAQPPLVESNYIFQVMPDKGVYAYDEYNQVWTDEPKEKDYKAATRLWTKPKRHKGDYDAVAESSSEPAASSGEVSYAEDEGDWNY
jgi:hypothetical protein